MGKRSREKRERKLLEKREEKKYFYQSSLERICLNIIKTGTYLILFTPLILSGRFFFPFVGLKSLYFMGLAEIIFFSWLFLIIFHPRYRPRFNLILGSLIFFLIVLIISAALGVDPTYSFWSKFERMTGILMMLHLFTFFLVISSTFEERDWKRFFAVSLSAAVIIGIIASTSENPAMRGGGTLGNDSFLGTYLLFNLFFALYLILKNEFRIYSSICFSLILLSLFLSGARAAQLSFLGGLVLFFFLWLAFYQKGKLRWLGISLLSVSIILSLSFFYFSFQPESFVRKEIIEKTVGETFGGRFVVWEKGWQGFLERPFFGWGPENFEFSFTKHYNPCMGTNRCGSDIWYDRAHNIIFDTLVTTGIFGTLAYLGIFISLFYILWRNYFQKKFDFWLSAIFTVLLISYFIQNLTVFDMVSSYMIFFLTLGFIGNLASPPSEIIERRPFFKGQPIIGLILFLFLIFSLSKFVIKPLQTDFYVIETLRTKDSKERLALAKKTLETSPVSRYQIRDFFSDQLIRLVQTETPSESIKDEFDFISQELEKSIKESPWNFRAYLKLGQTYNAYIKFDTSKLPRAKEVLEKAIEISPTNQQAYWALAQNLIYQGDFERALSLAEKAVELEPNLPQSHLIVIQVVKFMGDQTLVQEKVERALKIHPDLESKIREILGG